MIGKTVFPQNQSKQQNKKTKNGMIYIYIFMYLFNKKQAIDGVV